MILRKLSAAAMFNERVVSTALFCWMKDGLILRFCKVKTEKCKMNTWRTSLILYIIGFVQFVVYLSGTSDRNDLPL